MYIKDGLAATGDVPGDDFVLKGDIEFRNVTFSYPGRKNAKIFKNFSIRVAEGETVALVGSSGSG